MNQNLQIYTIGHSNHQIEIFLDLLHQHHIEVLVDIRSRPFSKYTPHFDKANLKELIKEVGIKYLFMGKELGGRPEGAEFYGEKGFVIYSRLANAPFFLEEIERLMSGIQQFRVAIMCSEETPENCHRRLLVGRVLRDKGVLVEHIRANGSLQQDTELKQANGQLALFDAEEVTEWRSIQSVLPIRLKS